MLSFYDIALTVTTSQVALLLGRKWFANSDKKEDDDCLERHAKTAVKSPEAFSESTGDWASWKVGTRSTFGLMGLTRALDDREHALSHPVKNAAVRHLPCQATTKGAASSSFSRVTFSKDGNVA